MKQRLNLESALVGSLKAINEGTTATDAVVIILDRNTGEFHASGFPTDINRLIEIMEKALSRLKRQHGREIRKKTGIILPVKH